MTDEAMYELLRSISQINNTMSDVTVQLTRIADGMAYITKDLKKGNM